MKKSNPTLPVVYVKENLCDTAFISPTFGNYKIDYTASDKFQQEVG